MRTQRTLIPGRQPRCAGVSRRQGGRLPLQRLHDAIDLTRSGTHALLDTIVQLSLEGVLALP